MFDALFKAINDPVVGREKIGAARVLARPHREYPALLPR